MLEKSQPTSSTPASAEPERHEARPLRIALFTEEDGGDWHAGQLIAAMERRGASVTRTALSACAFDSNAPGGLEIPGFAGSPPDGAFVRAISSGTLEQITFRLGILHALSASGIRVWNEARVIERCVDKSTASFLFQRAGIPHPATRVTESTSPEIMQNEAEFDRQKVLKPLFGSQGTGIARINAAGELPPPGDVGHVYYLQDYVYDPAIKNSDTAFEDWRVLVSGGRVLAAMVRTSTSWITNVHQGASPMPHTPDEEMSGLAIRAAAAVGADYAGIDLIRGSDGKLYVLEINSNPAWKGLQSVTDVDIADGLADDFMASLDAVGAQK